MNDEIVITTEKVKIEDLTSRERQIYEHAYKEGRKAGRSLPWEFFAIALAIFLVLSGWALAYKTSTSF